MHGSNKPRWNLYQSGSEQFVLTPHTYPLTTTFWQELLLNICFSPFSLPIPPLKIQFYHSTAQAPELLPQHTWDSHMESRFRHVFAGPFTQALPPILAFPVKFSGTWFSGMMFINNVETTYKEAGRVAGTIYFLYSLLHVKNLT